MQRPDEKKRQLIAQTAARLFATRPFHKVKLDDVAAEAGVGKGTLYIYFKSKEDLYLSLIYDGFAALVRRLEEEIQQSHLRADEALRRVVAALVRFGFENPQAFELMRTAGPVIKHERWQAKRTELTGLIEQTIRRGNAEGVFDDPHPEITALCVPGFMRSVMLFGPRGLDETVVREQILHLLERGIRSGNQTMKREKNRRSAVTSERGGQ